MNQRRVFSITLLFAAAAISTLACDLDVEASGAGKSCSGGRCSPGYVCSADLRCVVDVLVAGNGGKSIDFPGSGGVIVGAGGKGGASGHETPPGAGAGGVVISSGGASQVVPDAGTAPPDAGGVGPTTDMDASPPHTADAACANPAVYHLDADGDGFGRSDVTLTFCAPPGAGWVAKGGDCNDAEAAVFPGQSKYFGTPYAAAGGDSFDYDCSGSEDGDPAAAGPAPDCPVLSLGICDGSGFARTGRSGKGVDPTCGSAEMVTCGGLLACAATSSMVMPKGCR